MSTPAPNTCLPGFTGGRFRTGDADIAFEHAGEGPPLLLIHGYPQTRAAWRHVAPELARDFSVVAPDLRGYGDSLGPAGDGGRAAYTKRAMGSDLLALMQSLGHRRFAILAHDRGARVGYRLALDQPEAVSAFSSLTVVPTEAMWRRAGMAFGLKAWHWYFFAQPFDLPERLLRAEPAWFLNHTLRQMLNSPDEFDRVFAGAANAAALAHYHQAFARESVRHAMMEDYRAGASTDLEHDRADLAASRRMACPVQVLWSTSHTARPSPLEIWREDWADDVVGATIACGHLMVEEAPREVMAEVLPFLQRHARVSR